MNKIQDWMRKFQKYWEQKDVEKVLNLFADEVEYHETPSERLENKQEIRNEWESVKKQESISIDWEVFSSTESKHTVRWSLYYEKDGQERELEGVYLIELDSKGKCIEFWQYCQSE